MVNQDGKLLEKVYKKKDQQNLALVDKAKTFTKHTGTKATKVGKINLGTKGR